MGKIGERRLPNKRPRMFVEDFGSLFGLLETALAHSIVLIQWASKIAATVLFTYITLIKLVVSSFSGASDCKRRSKSWLSILDQLRTPQAQVVLPWSSTVNRVSWAGFLVWKLECPWHRKRAFSKIESESWWMLAISLISNSCHFRGSFPPWPAWETWMFENQAGKESMAPKMWNKFGVVLRRVRGAGRD